MVNQSKSLDLERDLVERKHQSAVDANLGLSSEQIHRESSSRVTCREAR